MLMVQPNEQHEAFTVAAALPPIGRRFRFVALPVAASLASRQPANAREVARGRRNTPSGSSVRSRPALAMNDIRVFITASRALSGTPVTQQGHWLRFG
jgi:hypothetical protein